MLVVAWLVGLGFADFVISEVWYDAGFCEFVWLLV